MNAGDAYLLADVDIHLWVVISDPLLDPIKVVSVNLTTWKPYHDQACVLTGGEHPWVKHKTCVNYREARIASDEDLETLKAHQLLIPQQPFSQELLELLRSRVMDSRMPEEAADILMTQGLVE